MVKLTERGFVSLPERGNIKDWLATNDIVYCDLITKEYWIKTKIKIISKLKTLNIGMELKCNLDYSFESLKILLIKTGLNFWINTEKENHFHYIFDKSTFRTQKSNINLVCEDFGNEEEKNLNLNHQNSKIGRLNKDTENYEHKSKIEKKDKSELTDEISKTNPFPTKVNSQICNDN